MTFLKINDLELHRTYDYSAIQVENSKTFTTASGRNCREIIAYKWQITASYDYFPESLRQELLNTLKAGEFEVTFYNPDTSEPLTATCYCTKLPTPKIAKFNGNIPAMWHSVGFTLEEV